MLKEKHWVWVIYGCCQKPFGIIRKSRINYFESRSFCKPRFVGLRVERSSLNSSSTRHSDHYICFFVPTVVIFGQIIYNRVESGRDKIGKLHFDNRFIPVYRKSHSSRNNGRFANRSISNSIFSELFYKSFCDFKSTSIFGNILPHYNQIIVLI